MRKLILVNAKDKPIFVKSGKDLIKIFPADTSAPFRTQFLRRLRDV